MIKNIQLKFGRSVDSPPETINTTPVTVFVGPNNSGKSMILSEIHQLCTSGRLDVSKKILENIEFEESSEQAALDRINSVKSSPQAGHNIPLGYIDVGKYNLLTTVHENDLKQSIINPQISMENFCQGYLKHNTLILNGENRINLVNQQPAGDLQSPSNFSFQILFTDNDKRAEVRKITKDAFGKYLVIDPTEIGQLRLRLSSREPSSEIEERGIHDDARRFHAAAQLIDDTSDGVKAFTGMITEIIAGDPLVLLIDEPEAFLHPPLSKMLGKEISDATAKTEKSVCVSTHSSSFVMGCIQSSSPVTIVRLTYQNGKGTARILTNDDLLPLMRNPLLRSTGVLEALFYEFVIVTEGDTDRAFYQEINERLLAAGKGIKNCLFLNAQNKQTVKDIIKPLRKIGIPAVGIVDIDIVKEGGKVWSGLIESCSFPELDHRSLQNYRSNLKKKLESTKPDMKKGGIKILPDQKDIEGANNFFDNLSKYGLFVVRGGELESWLPKLSVTGHKSGWLIKTFELMGDDPDYDTYVKPDNDDVWEFMETIKTWFTDVQRKGIPD